MDAMDDTNRRFDAIVIGVGAMGAAALCDMARRGARVLGLERFDIPHALGSSHGHSRMIRMAYYEHPDYVPLLRRAYELWHALQAQGGMDLFHLTGGLYIGPPQSMVIAGAGDSARRHNLAHEMLDAAQIMRRFEPFDIPSAWVGLYERDAGYLVPERVIAAYAALALRHGARLHGREEVLSWEADGAGAAVRTSRGVYRADKLLLCGGAWSEKLAGDLGVKMTVTRQVLGWVWPDEPDRFEEGRFPVWAIDREDGSIDYGFPMMADNPGLKIAHHGPGAITDPDKVDRNLSAADEADLRLPLQRYLHRANGPLLSTRVCLYTNSPDGHFIIDQHPARPRVTLACGFSGHGFKFASVVGEILADLTLTGSTQWPVEFLRLSRFGRR